MAAESSRQLELYRSMRRIRRVEEALIDEYHPAGQMRCPMHFCVGQEAIPAALGMALIEDDVVGAHYRSHGYYLAKGAPLDAMIAEFYGKDTGPNHGVGGSMGLAHQEYGFYSGSIVGGPTAIAVGSALAQKFLRSNGITVAVFGDGAMDEGVAYEAINLAVLRELPILFLCENNQFAVHARLPTRSHGAGIAGRARAFGIDAEMARDADPEELLERIGNVVQRVRSRRRPFFLEVDTYRFSSHVGPEDDDYIGYRSAEELAARKAADPLELLRERLRASGGAASLTSIDAAIEREIIDAFDAAKRAPFPETSSAPRFVLSNSYDPVVKHFVEGAAGFEGAQAEAKLAPY